MQIEHFKDYELKKYTTFKIGGNAKNLYFPKNIEELVFLLKNKTGAIVLGGCSNVLISSSGVENDVILTSKLSNYEFTNSTLRATCGVKGPLLAKECKKLGLSGFEFMIGFPGTIGGMLYTNASAHNQAINDCFISATIFDRNTSTIIKLNKQEMAFAYRNSILTRKNYVVLESYFELNFSDKGKISELMERNLEFRKLRQPPLTFPNAGSIFKNPDNDSAGRLLDLAGAKQLTVGGAKVFENHSNFIINFNNATSNDVIKLMYKMYNVVKEKYTIELKSEIKYLGTKNKEEEKLWQIITGENTASTQK